MDNNTQKDNPDPRVKHPKPSWIKDLPKLLEFENWIYKKFIELKQNDISIPSAYLTEIADEALYLQPAPRIFCVYDFVDEFLEEGGIEVSYNSNMIQFKQIDAKLKNTHLEEKMISLNSEKEKQDNIAQTIGLLVIGWGTALTGIARGSKIEELSKFRASQLGRFDWTRFNSNEQLDWWISREKREAFRNICRIASSEFQSRIKELDYINIGLKKLISKDNIELNWFSAPVQEKISNIVEFNEENEPSLRDLLVKISEI
ncbi:MAG: hypothetical protein ACFFKA_02895 [Candidatus Thorarchaeota archaeon]